MSELLAVGADGARGGWVAASAYADGRVELRLADTFADLAGDAGVPVAVDVPMGLLDEPGPRPCDVQARALLGARASTIFAPPPRRVLAATSYAEARATAQGLSAQAFGLVAKVWEAEEYLRAHPDAQAWLWECHPELSFRALAGGRVLRDKKSVGGQAERLRLVSARFPGVLDALAAFAPGRRAAEPADALDALAVLAGALRIRAGEHEQLGGEPDALGLAMRIVF
jgi:predicted RNase H-like nuclease